MYRSRRPQESLGYVGLARVAMSRNQAPAALDLLLEAVRRTPGDFLAWRLLARAYALNGRSAEAHLSSARAAKLPQFRGWLSFDPRLQEAHRLARTQRYLENQLHIATSSGQFALAAELARELLARRPGDAEVLARLAGCYHKLGRGDLASQSADAAAQAAPASPAVRRMQAEIALTQGRNAAAGAAAEALLQSDPDSARGHELLGRVRFLQGDTEQGIRLVRRAVELDPDAAEARQVLVTMLSHVGRPDEAAAVMEGRAGKSDEGKAGGAP
jgi:predicted Zn-dependent protease